VRNEDFYFLAEGLFEHFPEYVRFRSIDRFANLGYRTATMTQDLRDQPDVIDKKGKGKATIDADILRD
jgi:hypothetical protein